MGKNTPQKLVIQEQIDKDTFVVKIEDQSHPSYMGLAHGYATMTGTFSMFTKDDSVRIKEGKITTNCVMVRTQFQVCIRKFGEFVKDQKDHPYLSPEHYEKYSSCMDEGEYIRFWPNTKDGEEYRYLVKGKGDKVRVMSKEEFEFWNEMESED